ncbi:MAG: hypothetical protein NTZ18_02165 [Candidatus Komeilibacteria bacterium]|nr:hypothetical protein [Candidatus Komeilibacteria bacterium]
MDMGTHLFVGIVTATVWPHLSHEQQIITVIFALLPDSFEWLHQMVRKKENGHNHLSVNDYNKLASHIGGWIMLPYIFLHSLFAPLIFFGLSWIYDWPMVYSLMWFVHLLLDLPSHKLKLGLKLWWPFSQKRLHGFFDWWLAPFFRGWELWGYWAILSVVSVILIRKFW